MPANRMFHPIATALVVTFVLTPGAGWIAAAGDTTTAEQNIPALTAAERLATILTGFDTAQANTDTLTAEFRETKILMMLREPVESSGSFYFSKPHRVKWEYREPETKIYLLTEDTALAYYPAQKRAEKKNIQKYSAKLFRAFGIGQTTDELSKYYDIHLAPGSDRDGTYLLILLPKKRRLQKLFETLRMWIDQDTFLPVQMEYLEPDGDSTLLRFDSMQVNREIQSSRYQIDLPGDVTITNSFSGIGGTSQ